MPRPKVCCAAQWRSTQRTRPLAMPSGCACCDTDGTPMRSSGSMRWPRPTRHCRSRTQTGGALFGLTRVQEAEAAIRRAVELDPQQAVALAGLARIASYRGASEQARALAQRAIERMPDYPDAQLSLAAVELGERQLGVAETRLRGLLADSHDAQGRTSEAFVAYTESARLQREANAAQFATASPSALQYALGLVDYLRSAALEWAGIGCGACVRARISALGHRAPGGNSRGACAGGQCRGERIADRFGAPVHAAAAGF